jgi:hypothetical protein
MLVSVCVWELSQWDCYSPVQLFLAPRSKTYYSVTFPFLLSLHAQ